MYDKLGDLLKQTLEKGQVKFVNVNDTADNANKNSSESTLNGTENSKEDSILNERIKKNINNSRVKQRPKATYFIIKNVTPEVKEALKLFGLTEQSSKEELKAAYKQKLKSFHPDKYQNNEIVKQIAEKKTKQIIEGYSILDKFFS